MCPALARTLSEALAVPAQAAGAARGCEGSESLPGEHGWVNTAEHGLQMQSEPFTVQLECNKRDSPWQRAHPGMQELRDALSLRGSPALTQPEPLRPALPKSAPNPSPGGQARAGAQLCTAKISAAAPPLRRFLLLKLSLSLRIIKWVFPG